MNCKRLWIVSCLDPPEQEEEFTHVVCRASVVNQSSGQRGLGCLGVLGSGVLGRRGRLLVACQNHTQLLPRRTGRESVVACSCRRAFPAQGRWRRSPFSAPSADAFKGWTDGPCGLPQCAEWPGWEGGLCRSGLLGGLSASQQRTRGTCALRKADIWIIFRKDWKFHWGIHCLCLFNLVLSLKTSVV